MKPALEWEAARSVKVLNGKEAQRTGCFDRVLDRSAFWQLLYLHVLCETFRVFQPYCLFPYALFSPKWQAFPAFEYAELEKFFDFFLIYSAAHECMFTNTQVRTS